MNIVMVWRIPLCSPSRNKCFHLSSMIRNFQTCTSKFNNLKKKEQLLKVAKLIRIHGKQLIPERKRSTKNVNQFMIRSV